MKLHPMIFAAALGLAASTATVFADPPAADAQAAAAPDTQAAADNQAAPVDAPTSPASDSELAKRVKAAMSGNSVTHRLPVRVAVTEGVVRLTGNVTSVQADQAEYVASTVPGVREVNNQLRRGKPNS